MYMKNVMYKIIMGCYIVAALVLVTACNDNLDYFRALAVSARGWKPPDILSTRYIFQR